jgi:tetratricopeptide (TPR) repeat protein
VLYQDHPKDLVVKKNYIQLLILKDRIDEARKLNDEVVKAKRDDPDAQVYKGEIEIRSGKASDAVNTLQAVLKNDPDNAVAHYQLGLAFDQLGNTSRAEAEWRDAVRLRPDIVEVYRALAGVAIHRGDPGELAKDADQIIALQPAAPDGYLLRAVADIDRKQYATADEYIHRSLEKEPNNTAAYVQLGNLRFAQNKYAEAQKAYQQGLDQDPNSTDALGGVLNVDLVQKQPDRAIAAVKTQLAKYPRSAGFHIMMGQLLLDQKKDLAGAEQEFKQAAELDKKNSEALVKLGAVQNERGATDQALQTYLDGSKANPKEIAFHLLAGGIYESRQDWDNAKQQYRKVLEIQPENPLASNNLAYVMLQQGGNVDVAFAMAQTARKNLPDNANTADTLGWAFYHKQVYTSAINLFKEAVKKEPDNALFNYHLGLAYAKSGQAALAKQQLDRVVRIKPNFPDVDKLRQAVDEAKG